MARDLDLKRRLELAGLIVTEIDGWQTRGKDDCRFRGSVNHHTAGPRTGVEPSLHTIINGRSDLPGPLANVHGPREESLRVNLVAAGKANHAGEGGWRGLSGNATVWGLEEEHCGYADEPISELRKDRMARVHAAFLFGTSTSEMTCQHYEWAPTRKIDFVRALLDPDEFRLRVAGHLSQMAGHKPTPAPTPTWKDDEMLVIIDPDNGHKYLLHAGKMVFTPASSPDAAGVPVYHPTRADLDNLILAYGKPIPS